MGRFLDKFVRFRNSATRPSRVTSVPSDDPTKKEWRQGKGGRAGSGCLPQLLVVSSEQIFEELGDNVGRGPFELAKKWNCSTTNAIHKKSGSEIRCGLRSCIDLFKN